MLLEAVVSYGEHFALYHLSSESEGVYQAELVKFYGSPNEAAPPEQVLLVKGVRKWIGHPVIPELLNDLGQAIESSLQDREKVAQHIKGEPTNPDGK